MATTQEIISNLERQIEEDAAIRYDNILRRTNIIEASKNENLPISSFVDILDFDTWGINKLAFICKKSIIGLMEFTQWIVEKGIIYVNYNSKNVIVISEDFIQLRIDRSLYDENVKTIFRVICEAMLGVTYIEDNEKIFIKHPYIGEREFINLCGHEYIQIDRV